MPGVVDDLATLIPADAGFVVELPSIDKLAEFVPADQRAAISMLRPVIERGAAEQLKVDADALHDLIDAFDRAEAFGDARSVGVVLRFKKRPAVEKLLASMTAVPAESIAGRAVFKADGVTGRIVWYPGPRIVVWSDSPAVAAQIERAASGQAPSFAKNPRRLPDAPTLRAYADLARLAKDDAEARKIFEAGSAIRAEVGYDGKSTWSKSELSLVGERIPRIAGVLDASKSALAPRLPDETIGFLSISLARKQGRSIRDLVIEAGRAADSSLVATLVDARAKTELGVGLDDLDALLGNEIVAGVAAAPGVRIDTEGTTDFEQAAFFAIAPTKDDAKTRRLVTGIGKLFGGKNAPHEYKVAATPTAVRFTPTSKAVPAMRLDMHKGALLFTAGGTKWMDRVARALDTGERPLAAVPKFKASGVAEKPANAVLWFDLVAAQKALGKPIAAGFDRAAVLRALFGPSPRGLDATLEGENGAEVFVAGAGAAVGIYAVRRYLKAAKTAEAKNTVGAIARAAVTAYEREDLQAQAIVHRLCKSAIAVPTRVPAGTKYAPSTAGKVDFETGDDRAGWRCLRFAMTDPHYYQYEYRQGGPYKGPARGGPDPGPNGFEVSAEGDLDGNGKTSLFTRIGTIDPKTHSVKVSTEIFISDEFE
jgi:hypothetical protein